MHNKTKNLKQEFPYLAGRLEALKYAYMYEKLEPETLRLRAKGSLEYFINKAAFYKLLWIVLSAMSIALPALSAYVIALKLSDWITNTVIASLSLATTMVTGFLALFKCADKKIMYRDAAEAMKSEISRYLNQTGEYAACGEPSACGQLLAQNLERLIQSCNQRIVVLEKGQTRIRSDQK